MPDLGIKNDPKDDMPIAAPSLEGKKNGMSYPSFSIRGDHLEKADLPKDLEPGDTITATVELQVSNKTLSDSEESWNNSSIEFKVLSIDVEGGSQSEQDAEDKEEEVLGFKREKSSAKKPSAKDLE